MEPWARLYIVFKVYWLASQGRRGRACHWSLLFPSYLYLYRCVRFIQATTTKQWVLDGTVVLLYWQYSSRSCLVWVPRIFWRSAAGEFCNTVDFRANIMNFSGQCHLVLAISNTPREVSYYLGQIFLSWSLRSSFQHAVVRNINDKNAQIQKQLENVVQEGAYFEVYSLLYLSVSTCV